MNELSVSEVEILTLVKYKLQYLVKGWLITKLHCESPKVKNCYIYIINRRGGL